MLHIRTPTDWETRGVLWFLPSARRYLGLAGLKCFLDWGGWYVSVRTDIFTIQRFSAELQRLHKIDLAIGEIYNRGNIYSSRKHRPTAHGILTEE